MMNDYDHEPWHLPHMRGRFNRENYDMETYGEPIGRDENGPMYALSNGDWIGIWVSIIMLVVSVVSLLAWLS